MDRFYILTHLSTDYKNTYLDTENRHENTLTIRKRLVYITRMKRELPSVIREYMASLGRIGGKAKSPGKALSSEQARANIMARWNRPGARKSDQNVKP